VGKKSQTAIIARDFLQESRVNQITDRSTWGRTVEEDGKGQELYPQINQSPGEKDKKFSRYGTPRSGSGAASTAPWWKVIGLDSRSQ